MSHSLRNGLIRLVLIAMLACYYVGGLVADNPRDAAPSQFAPFADLAADLDRQICQLEQAAEPSTSAGEDSAALRDRAHLIAIVASQMALHDQRQTENGSLAADLPSLALPDLADGQERAVLVRQLPRSYEQIRQGIYSSRFSREYASLAGRCSTLALLAHYCGQQKSCRPDDATPSDWEQACFELRDSAAEVNRACHRQSQTAAVAAVSRLERSCAAWQVVARGELGDK